MSIVYLKIAYTERTARFQVQESWSINDFLHMSKEFIRSEFQITDDFELVDAIQHTETNIPAEEAPALTHSTDKFVTRFQYPLENSQLAFYIRIIT